MGKIVVQLALLGLMLAVVYTLPNKEDWDIYKYHINSTVTDGYAITIITSRVVNRRDQPTEIEFHVKIPKNAFISQFKMSIEGQMYDGVVKAKEEAQQQYSEAMSRGQSAGLVSSVGRSLEEFTTSVTVAAHQKVTFELTHEELLKRRLGQYELQIYARPMQPVNDFKIDVSIYEQPDIVFSEVKGGLNNPILATIGAAESQNQLDVHFHPTVEQQTLCGACGDDGLNGDLVIVYDVFRDETLGHLKESDGFFVHHFAPTGLARISKNVIFVIDQSGSMQGRKMRQTRAALVHILADLAMDDYFGLITFNHAVHPWKRELVQANEHNVGIAKEFARTIEDHGSTDINSALLDGAKMLNQNPRDGSASILILLTDGDPTTGERNPVIIQKNVMRAINKKFPLYCLGFGHDVNFEFLEKMSLENSGVARRIYDDTDADLQLKGFYAEVATPLLTNVMLIYEGGANLTQTNFSHYYNGSEIVVAGQITDNNIETFSPRVVAISGNKHVEFSETNSSTVMTASLSESNTRRLWAYLTVKQLLDKELQLDGEEKERAKQEVLELSLKYRFVTPHTSMVVTKPPGENAQVLHKPKEGEKHPLPRGGFFRSVVSSLHYDDPSFPAQRLHGTANRRRQGTMHPSSRGPAGRRVHPQGSMDSDPSFTAAILHGGGHVLHQDSMDSDPSFTAAILHGGGHVLHQDSMDSVSITTVLQRFVRKTVNGSLPLCYDLNEFMLLKLLHNPNRELSINGQLESYPSVGFKRIVIHNQNQRIDINQRHIRVNDGQNATKIRWEPNIIDIQRGKLIQSHNKTTIMIEDSLLIIMRHEKKGKSLLWPIFSQVSNDPVEGLLAVKPLVYESVSAPSGTVTVSGKTFTVSEGDIFDYSVTSAPRIKCWLTSAENALEGRLFDFLVSDL
ncbi:inter-alpha-trypsin inhibitor heavy chain H3 isoform X29 [Gadus morhua]|uniref:inter-alpha-trypsin inhibitor heavy chain H3 isoform X26 n=1 Tax=Gadus morhua TaxID=8049 RepID=UPI0011B76856|nr:inter-alpha-trypsin inhibitor heavy chain H3-like isoform X26 [Gadus morhua]XP_030230361.1 inter-alpha-trypsin inhibitor heavy chain H3-like isoform X27 [Gadus morhua]XP_030230362.1 inter-alpha-trypsin inhibitor heavy chain H3-like isoform X28 [Gadus morhua]XP_030230363.1 inter-alpha-trypsin inhibitor heavy chain H3-like isoform X29 [Gadus morhua]